MSGRVLHAPQTGNPAIDRIVDFALKRLVRDPNRDPIVIGTRQSGRNQEDEARSHCRFELHWVHECYAAFSKDPRRPGRL